MSDYRIFNLIAAGLPFVGATVMTTAASDLAPIPGEVDQFLVKYCLDCHDADTEKGDVNLDFVKIDWKDMESLHRWSMAHEALDTEEMPPEDKDQPSAEERAAVVAWLDDSLTRLVPPGGTVLRRLNREEYENSVREIIGIPFAVGNGFPVDSERYGFDNVGEALVLSPPLMAQYVKIATGIADSLIPAALPEDANKPKVVNVAPMDFNQSAATNLIDGVLRLTKSGKKLHPTSALPVNFEAKVSGVYQLECDLSAFKPASGHVPLVQIFKQKAEDGSSAVISKLPMACEWRLDSEEAKTYRAEFELQRGETVAVHYKNGPLQSEQSKDFKSLGDYMLSVFANEPALGLAWVMEPPQKKEGSVVWAARIRKTQETLSQADIDAFDPRGKRAQDFVNQLVESSPGSAIGPLAALTLKTGPSVDVHQMTITGPVRLIPDKEFEAQLVLSRKFLGERDGRSDREFAEAILRRLLTKAFRRSVSEEQVAGYVGLVLSQQADGHRFEDGIHLALRTALCSPHFLYRGSREGELDDFDLASRLSYFLTSGPPDQKLIELASAGKLASNPEILEGETRRLLEDGRVMNFLDSFTGQWLDLRKLPEIMPDERLGKWSEKSLASITAETQLFVAEILRENLPLDTFIDPDFTYLDSLNAGLYGMKLQKPEGEAAKDKDAKRRDKEKGIKSFGTKEMRRVSLEPGGRRGGILGQASVMMATANGVDTQPVLRGAWMLENVFGQPTPEAPSDVPAIEPDTRGAKSIRDLLELHTKDAKCAGCHQRIDPPGFLLESFDPIGQWRDFYPVYKTQGDKVITKDGLPVDSVALLEDGTELKDVTDLKRYLVENIDIFAHCLTEKLFVYGTGRPPGFGDRKEIRRLVEGATEEGKGFQDLIVALVLSESFRMK
jgi:hypothetical protein